ncbi:cycloartenol synthase [Artemisia annua]|uniref:Cycloartenol synthase n=1 Tax=Artemisia annua TaxID=35608 RepID=A0A2U1KSL5_ARTAN|nr:cycloartenol synthase [Artemisia annua]
MTPPHFMPELITGNDVVDHEAEDVEGGTDEASFNRQQIPTQPATDHFALSLLKSKKMWKLKVSEDGSPWLRSSNNHYGRQVWEFDPELGSLEEIAEVEEDRKTFVEKRFKQKHSSDILMRIQFAKENQHHSVPPHVEIKYVDDITEEKVANVLRRAIGFHSSLQADDGHWPGDNGGPLFLLPGLVS